MIAFCVAFLLNVSLVYAITGPLMTKFRSNLLRRCVCVQHIYGEFNNDYCQNILTGMASGIFKYYKNVCAR